MKPYTVGMKVTVIGWGGDERTATIERFDHKNGRALVDLKEGGWAYVSQLAPAPPPHPELGSW